MEIKHTKHKNVSRVATWKFQTLASADALKSILKKFSKCVQCVGRFVGTLLEERSFLDPCHLQRGPGWKPHVFKCP